MDTKPKAMLYDMVLCSGCRACIRACMDENGFEGDPEEVTELSATARTAMTEVGDYPLRDLCRHCLAPTCVSACPVGALLKTDAGPVIWDADRCIGCRYCMIACPFNIPRYEWHSRVPKVQKCDMCYHRIAEGGIPACAQACPEEATLYGDREDLLRIARERIRNDPDEYYDHIYGEKEIGGTSVLFLAPYPVDQLGFRERLGTHPLPELTLRVLEKIPGVLTGGMACLLGIWWITKRRDEVAEFERLTGGNGDGHAYRRNYRLGFWRGMFFLIIAIGLACTILRYYGGLGAVSNLSDRYPWGLWKAFNVLVGIGLGGAGFTLMGVVYIFHARRFRPIVRPAVLMAFLAYTSAAAALTIDIGRSWTIWHPIVMWNGDSVLFEVAWCLMLYTIVLLLEGSGMLFEKLGRTRLLRIQRAVTLPVVIAGILLSTLHQSSLGTLFLIVPGKLHALWYSPMLPVLFYLSAICVGLAMLIVMSRLSARAFGRQFEVPMLEDLGRVLVALLGAYGVTRLFDLGSRGSLAAALEGSYEAWMFQLEFVVGVLLPFALLASPKMRRNARGLYGASLLVVAGFVLNRLNVGLTGFEGAQGGHYWPTWSEVFITLMVVAMAFGAFGLAVRFLPVYPEPKRNPTELPITPAERRSRLIRRSMPTLN